MNAAHHTQMHTESKVSNVWKNSAFFNQRKKRYTFPITEIAVEEVVHPTGVEPVTF